MSHLPAVPAAREVIRHAQLRRLCARRRARGFTLIEIMVVVIIIGLLAVIVAQNLIKPLDDAHITKAKADIAGLNTALKFYYLDNSTYPTSEQGLKALVTQPTDANLTHWRRYLDGGLPKDPWGRDYLYAYPGTHGEPYDLYTLGADGQPGGEGPNADIGNWGSAN